MTLLGRARNTMRMFFSSTSLGGALLPLWQSSILNEKVSLIFFRREQRKALANGGAEVEISNTYFKMSLDMREMRDFLLYEIMRNETGYYEPETTILLTKHLHEGSVFLDIGANNGYFTLLASKLVGPTGRVLSFEPNPSSYLRLAKNTRTNNIQNVVARQCAVGNMNGLAQLYLSDYEDGLSSMHRKSGRSIPVSVCRLDDVQEARDADIIKVDVEGYELPVLHGMKEILDSRPNLKMVIEWNYRFHHATPLLGLLQKRFHVYAIGRSRQKTLALRPVRSHTDLPNTWCNLWCSKTEETPHEST